MRTGSPPAIATARSYCGRDRSAYSWSPECGTGMAMRGAIMLGAQADLFLGGFLFSRFGASLFPIRTVSHIRACLTSSSEFQRPSTFVWRVSATHVRIVEFACTCGSVLGPSAIVAESADAESSKHRK